MVNGPAENAALWMRSKDQDGDGVGAQAIEELPRAASGPRAMSRVLELFRALSRERKGMTLSQLAATIDVPKSTLVTSLRQLVSDGYLVTEGPIYRLGSSAFRLAAEMMSAFSLPETMRPYVRTLAEQTRESVGFAVADWEAGRAIYVEAIQSSRPVRYTQRPGTSAPLYASAAGRVLLAFSDEDLVERYLRRSPFKPLTPKTQVDKRGIREQLTSIREKGYYISVGELLDDTAAMAAPVFDASGVALGAMMIGAPIERMLKSIDESLACLLDVSRRASGERGALLR